MIEKTNAQTAFDEAVKAVYELLKPLGFKKKALNFHRQEADIVQFINIQKSVYNSGQNITFTLNLGVDGAGKKLTSIHDFAVRERIGAVKNSGDFWYEFSDESPIFVRKQKHQAEKDLLIKDITDFVLPFFERFKTQNDIDNF